MVFDYDIKPGLRFVPKKSTDIDLDVSSAYCRSKTMTTLYSIAFLAHTKSYPVMYEHLTDI